LYLIKYSLPAAV